MCQETTEKHPEVLFLVTSITPDIPTAVLGHNTSFCISHAPHCHALFSPEEGRRLLTYFRYTCTCGLWERVRSKPWKEVLFSWKREVLWYTDKNLCQQWSSLIASVSLHLLKWSQGILIYFRNRWIAVIPFHSLLEMLSALADWDALVQQLIWCR